MRGITRITALCALAALPFGLSPVEEAQAAERTEDLSVFMQQAVDGGPVRLMPGVAYIDEMPTAAGLCRGITGFGDRIDCWHDWLFLRMQIAVENTDHALATNGTQLERVPAAPFRVGLDTEYFSRPDGAEFNFDLDLDVALQLPNFERRLRIFLTSTRLDEAPDEPLNHEADLRAGVRFELPQSFDFDVGVRAKAVPEAFAALSWRAVRQAANWRVYPFARSYLETDEGLGLTTALTLDRWWHRIVARSSTYLNWSNRNDEIEWDQSLTLGYAQELLEDRRYAYLARGRDFARGFGLSLAVSGGEIHGADSYRAMLFYKRPLRGRWLYWSVGQEVRWDREYDWNPDLGVRAGLDVLFWGLVDSEASRRRARAARDL